MDNDNLNDGKEFGPKDVEPLNGNTSNSTTHNRSNPIGLVDPLHFK